MTEDKILGYLIAIEEQTKEVPKIAERIAIVETSVKHLSREQLELHQEQKELEGIQSVTADTLKDVQVAIAQTNARCDSRTTECANRAQIESANISGRWKAIASIAGAIVALLIATGTALHNCNASSEAAERPSEGTSDAPPEDPYILTP